MPLYQITAPNGKTYRIEGPPGASDADVARAVLAQFPDAGKPSAPETTLGGQAKELVKGLIPGAVGLVEQAAIGASALLPQETEKTAREKIAGVAGAIKAPFAAAPGYEESVGRKLSEAIGSTVPFLLAGPFGLAGRAAAVGLGVSAGAGEARTRAEREGATEEQRATATALGIAPGALEAFAPLRILSRIPDAATAVGVQAVKRALVAGGEEAAQEAASNFAQNLIAKGVYKPEQELIEGLGEAAAYGGATGAIVQGLMDLALGRRARGAQPAPGEVAGESPIDRAERLKAEAQPPAPPAAPAAPPAEIPPAAEAPPALPPAEAPPALPAPEPVAEAPAEPAAAAAPAEEPISEPKVKKPGEVEPTGLQPTDIEALGISKKQPIYRRMLNKDMDDPAQREAVLADIENYLVKGHGSEESRAKLAEFKTKFEAPAPAPTPTPPAAETTAAPTPTPTEPPSVPTATPIEQPSGAGAPVVSEPGAGAAPGGAGVAEPSGVVPPVADVEQPAGGEGQQPVAVTPPTPTPPAPLPAAPKEKGSLENRIKALNVNAAVGGVPDLKTIREVLEPRDPKMYQAVAYYLGLDPEGNLLVGTNNMPQTPSAQEAGQMAGLGTNSGDRIKKVAKALGIDAGIIRKFQASQNEAFAVGRSRTASEAGTGALLESPEDALITDQEWYKPIAAKGLKGANHTEIARAALLGQRFLENEANIPEFQKLMGEVQARAKRPEFAAAFKSQQKLLAPDETGLTRGKADEEALASEPEYEDDVAPGQEEAIEGRGAERGDEDTTANLTPRPTPGVTSPDITDAVANGDTAAALDAIGKNTDATPLDNLVAKRFLGLGKSLGLPKIKMRSPESAQGSAEYDSKTDTVSIAEGQEDTHTVLHETAHAFVHKLIIANERGVRNDQGYRDLKALFDYLNKNYPDLKQEYGMSSLTEFASEAMSNPQFQKKLAKIPYKERSVWSAFVESVRKLLALPKGKSSALVEAMAGVDSLLSVGREYQTQGPDIGAGTAAVVTTESKAAAAKVDAIGERKEDRFRDKVGRQLAGNKALRLREKLTDSMAPMEAFFVDAFGGALRSASGRLNPMVLLSRALDSLRVSKAVQAEGGLFMQDGLLVAGDLKDADGRSVSLKGVLERIANAARSEKTDFNAYRKVIDNILYGHREFNLRKKNNEIEQQAQALEAAGKKNEAKKLRGEKVDLLLDDAQIDAAEDAFQKDKFIQGVLKDLDLIRFNLLDRLVEVGRISKEQAQDYKDALGYIPFKRIGDYENAWNGATRGANRGAAAFKNRRSLEGSSRQSESVIENFSGLVDWATKEAMKNHAVSNALDVMETLKAAKPGEAPYSDSPGGEVVFYKDGVPTKYYVPDPAHIATFSMADPQLSNFVKGLSLATRTLRAGVTSMPPFAVKQIFDDIVRAYTYAGVKNNGELVKNILFNFPKNWVNEMRGRKTAEVRNLERLGIVGTFDVTTHTNLKDILKESGAEKETLGQTILRYMEAGAKASDVSVRQAIYKQVLKETGDTAQAESAAREIINFSRRGSSRAMNLMISIVPFFNAYARGMDKLATAAAGGVVGQTTGTARSMFYKRMGVMTAMGLAYALMMQDDEEYQALPDHVRDTNWILPGGKALGFAPSIPVPAELAFFFKAIPERVIRYYKLQGTEEEQAAVDVLKQLLLRGADVFSSPNLMAQGLRPLFENWINYSFFLGRPLESQSQLKLDPSQRFGTSTSESMKALSVVLEDVSNATGISAIATSPIKLENAVRGIFGTAAGVALTMADAMINPGRTDRPLHQQLTPQLTGASALMKNPVGTRYMDEIYALEDRTERAYNTYNKLVQTDPDKATKYLEDNLGMYAIRDAVRGVMESIRALNNAAGLIDKDTSMSPEERRKAIDELRAEQNEIARTVFMLRREARNIQLGL